ncbi:MAG: hypothetical protein RLZ72_1250, partial [Actinomycetota bacterium]
RSHSTFWSRIVSRMELAFVLGGIVALSVILSIPAWRYQKRTGKRLGRDGSQ